jgi:hypothetical protein
MDRNANLERLADLARQVGLTQPPQKVVSSSTTSTDRNRMAVASCSKSTTIWFVEVGIGILSRTRAMPSIPQVGSSR